MRIFFLAAGIGFIALGILYDFNGSKPLRMYEKSPMGYCVLTGTIREFSLDCQKPVTKLKYKNFSAKHLEYFGPLNSSTEEKLSITIVDETKVQGHDLVKSTLQFLVIHSDDTQSLVKISK